MTRHYNFFLPSNFKNALTSVLLFSFMGFHQLGFTQDLPSNVPTDGLIGWWPFNGNANDESGNENHGTVMNNPTLTSDRFNETSSAYYFDGADDFIWLNFLSALNGSNQLTLSYWINSDLTFPPNFAQDGNYGYVFGHWIDNAYIGGPIGFQLAHEINGGIRVNFNGGQSSFSNELITNINTWNNFVLVYNGELSSNERVSLFKNGVFVQHIVDPNNIPSLIGTTSTRTYIGAACGPIGSNHAWAFFKGKIDDIGVWNRALNESEILTLHEGCSLLVTEQPTNQNAPIGGAVSFVTNASLLNTSFQWQTNIGLGYQNLSDAGQYSGANSNILTVSNITNSNHNQLFRCILTSAACSDTSQVAAIHINGTVDMQELLDDKVFSVYPNPASNHIQLKSNRELIGLSYTIYDLNGKIVHTAKILSENMIVDLSELASGVYILRLENQLEQSFRISKN